MERDSGITIFPAIEARNVRGDAVWIKPAYFVTSFGKRYKELPCGHYINVDHVSKHEVNFCYYLCHEDLAS